MKFKQIDVPEWPSGDVQFIAVLGRDLSEIEEHHAIRFRSGVDDLGEYKRAAIKLSSGRMLLLNRHANHPNPGIEVIADAADNVREALEELQNSLGLSDADVTWVNE